MLVQIESLVLLQILHYLLEASEEEQEALLKLLEKGRLSEALPARQEAEAEQKPKRPKTVVKRSTREEVLARARLHRGAAKNPDMVFTDDEIYMQ